MVSEEGEERRKERKVYFFVMLYELILRRKIFIGVFNIFSLFN